MVSLMTVFVKLSALPVLPSSFQEAVANRALIRLLLSFGETFLFVDDTKILHPHFSRLTVSSGW